MGFPTLAAGVGAGVTVAAGAGVAVGVATGKVNATGPGGVAALMSQLVTTKARAKTEDATRARLNGIPPLNEVT